ncbi:PREDICTED: fatty acid-binding protein-like [Papilio xuthus]|uniref:Fatty acid-binding protein 2 n=1 Tax=Papilio xuthus TaxID=66420 RepID=A0A194Q0Y2_PAPXU|nr:PREDICTED: fatty acid-binding protein-like [Papilio xuthus]KPI98973.1 Fatty acid-binding protein 2 [Papilio xuthus]
MAFEGKVYVHDRDENFEGFVATLGLTEDKLEKLKNYKPKFKLEKNGDTYTMTSFSDSRNNVVTFKLNEEFDEAVMDGRAAKTTFTLDGNTLTQVQKFEIGTITTKREFFDDKLIATINRSGWDGTAVRYYKA